MARRAPLRPALGHPAGHRQVPPGRPRAQGTHPARISAPPRRAGPQPNSSPHHASRCPEGWARRAALAL